MTRRRKNDITVNGIGLMEIMRIKMTTITKKTPMRKTVPRDKKKQAHMSTPPVGNITNYLTIRKRESNEITSNTKKTTPLTEHQEHKTTSIVTITIMMIVIVGRKTKIVNKIIYLRLRIRLPLGQAAPPTYQKKYIQVPRHDWGRVHVRLEVEDVRVTILRC